MIILQFARLQSKRVPQKLLRTVGGTSLLDRGLNCMDHLQKSAGVRCFIATHIPGNSELVDKALSKNVSIISLPESTIHAELWEEQNANVRTQLNSLGYSDTDLVWHTTLFCRPFLTQRTIRNILEIKQPCVTVQEKRGTVWLDLKGSGIGEEFDLANTKTNQQYWEFAHLGYILEVADYDRSAQEVKSRCGPYPISLSTIEKIDIDTFDDLAAADFIARGKDLLNIS